MRRILHLISVTLLLGIIISHPLSGSENAYSALARMGCSERAMYLMLQDMLREVPDVEVSRINFGGKYDGSKINLIIVDTKQFEAVSGPVNVGSSRIRFDQLYMNAAALEQNVVAVDSDLLSIILLCAVNRQKASSDHPHPRPLPEQNPAELMIFHQVVDDARRGEILDLFVNRLPARADLRNTASSLLSDLTGMQSRDQARYRQTIRVYALAFLPMLIHELAHLDSSVNVLGAHFNNPAEGILRRALAWVDAYRTREEEDRADAVAVAKLTPILQSLKIRMLKADVETDDKTFEECFRQLISLETYALIQRDLILQRAFSNFRGYRFEDVFYSIFHQPCKVDAATPEKINFYDFGKVAFAFNEPIPVLTRTEYERLRAGLDPLEWQTHAHAFQRSAQLLKLAQLKTDDASMMEIEQFESLLYHLRDGSSAVQFHFEYLRGRMNYTVAEFLNRLQESEKIYGHRYSVERAALCPLTECYVVRQTAVKGLSEREYFEVSAEQGVIVEIKYLSPILKDDAQHSNLTQVPPALKSWRKNQNFGNLSELYLYHLGNMLLAADLLFPADSATVHSIVSTIGMLRMYRLKCGNGMIHYEFKDRTILGRTTFTGDAIELSAIGR